MKKLLLLPLLLVTCFCFAQDAKEIIGKPINIGNLQIAQYDFPNDMNWYDARKACAALGKGWRLPTKAELNILYQNKDKIGGFAVIIYWSSTEIDNSVVCAQGFTNGRLFNDKVDVKDAVRAVKSL